MPEEINIVIGSWGSYNACNSRALGSEWFNLTKYESWDDIVKELKRQGFQLKGIDEELFVQDIEGIPSDGVNWDYIHPKALFETLKESGVLDNEKSTIKCLPTSTRLIAICLFSGVFHAFPACIFALLFA